MKLLLDQNLSRRMLKQLLPYYPDSSQAALLNMDKSDDAQVWEYAKNNDFVIVTKDSDFHDFSLVKGEPPKVIWVKCGNKPKQYIVDLLISHRERIYELIKSNAVLEIY